MTQQLDIITHVITAVTSRVNDKVHKPGGVSLKETLNNHWDSGHRQTSTEDLLGPQPVFSEPEQRRSSHRAGWGWVGGGDGGVD